MEDVSFKKRVLNTIISASYIYKSVLIDYEYLLYSTDFIIQPYYIIGAHENNYLHLTGVNTSLSPNMFFYKCLNRSLEEHDFDFLRRGQDEKSVKGSIRRKIKVLPLLHNLFDRDIYLEENFIKNKVHCSIATSDNKLTIGFVNTSMAYPKTLLAGNELNAMHTIKVSLVLRRKKGVNKFDTIVRGDVDILRSLDLFKTLCDIHYIDNK